MPNKPLKIKEDVPLLALLKETQNWTVDKLRTRLELRPGNRKSFDLEQKVIILKLLQLNEMNISKTCRECGVNRTSLESWSRVYGPEVFAAYPATAIAQEIDMDVAKHQAEVIINCYRMINRGLKRLEREIDIVKGPKAMSHIAEAIRAGVEVIRSEKETNINEVPKGTDFYTNINNMIIANAIQPKINGKQD